MNQKPPRLLRKVWYQSFQNAKEQILPPYHQSRQTLELSYRRNQKEIRNSEG